MGGDYNQVMSKSTDIRNRIVEHRRMRIGDLALNPFNPKLHGERQLNTLSKIIEKHGIVGEVYAYYSERLGGRLTLFDGHARHDINPDQVWDVGIIDLSDEEVDQLVLLYDHVTQLAEYAKATTETLIKKHMPDDADLLRAIADVAKLAHVDLVDLTAVNAEMEQEAPIKRIQSTPLPNAPDFAGLAMPSATPPTSNIRQIQLFFTVEQHAEFLELSTWLRNQFDTENATVTVLEVMRYAKNTIEADGMSDG